MTITYKKYWLSIMLTPTEIKGYGNIPIARPGSKDYILK